MKIAWVDTLVDYPIYGDLEHSCLLTSSYDISLPLAFVYLRSYITRIRPEYEFAYVPRRLLAAEGALKSLESYIADADIILTSCSAADSVDAESILCAAKALGKTTIVGGIFPRFSSTRVLNWGCVDYCITGEGEIPLLQVLDHIAGRWQPPKHWAGVCTPANRAYRRAPLCNLASLPQPDYSSLPLTRFQKYMKSAYILATRGCPAPCHFCTSARLYGYTYRQRPVHSVVAEIRDLYARGFTAITLADDTVTVDHDWAMSLFQMLADQNPGVALKVRARADELTKPLIKCMDAAGVAVVQFGIESINISTRTSMHKKLEQSAIDNAFDFIFATKAMKANTLFMLAYPGETVSDLERNVDYICQIGANHRVITYVSFTTPYPDTPFYELCRRGDGTMLTNKLVYFTNKFPVFVPASLRSQGAQHALDLLVSAYNRIAKVVNVSHYTQYPIPPRFFQDVNLSGDLFG